MAYGAASGNGEHVNPSILARYLLNDTERFSLLDALLSSLTTRNAFEQIVLTAVAYDGCFTANSAASAAGAAAAPPLASQAESTSLVPSGHRAGRNKRAKSPGISSTAVFAAPNGRRPARRCVLSKLRGHSNTLLPLIAEFADIPLGRPLRNIREALQWLKERASYDMAYDQLYLDLEEIDTESTSSLVLYPNLFIS